MNNQEKVNKIIQDQKIEISELCLTKILGCVPSACKGFCCHHHTELLRPDYSEEEIAKLPENIMQHIDEKNKVKFDENGDCKLIDFCMQNKALRPITCKLAPLGFSSTGRLIMKRWVWLKPCPQYKVGEEVYISMKNDLIEIFGESIYEQICEKIKKKK